MTFNEYKIPLGKFLQVERKRLNLNQMQVATKLNITPQFLSNIERGKVAPSDNLFKKFSKQYKFPKTKVAQIISDSVFVELMK